MDFALATCCGSLLEAIEKSPAQASRINCGCYAVAWSGLEKGWQWHFRYVQVILSYSKTVFHEFRNVSVK